MFYPLDLFHQANNPDNPDNAGNNLKSHLTFAPELSPGHARFTLIYIYSGRVILGILVDSGSHNHSDTPYSPTLFLIRAPILYIYIYNQGVVVSWS